MYHTSSNASLFIMICEFFILLKASNSISMSKAPLKWKQVKDRAWGQNNSPIIVLKNFTYLHNYLYLKTPSEELNKLGEWSQYLMIMILKVPLKKWKGLFMLSLLALSQSQPVQHQEKPAPWEISREVRMRSTSPWTLTLGLPLPTQYQNSTAPDSNLEPKHWACSNAAAARGKSKPLYDDDVFS